MKGCYGILYILQNKNKKSTPEFELAKLVDSTIKPFIPSKFMVKSTDEFLNRLRSQAIEKSDVCVSFDVKSLFTNVPRDWTIDLICNKIYDQDYNGKTIVTSEKSKITKDIFKKIF